MYICILRYVLMYAKYVHAGCEFLFCVYVCCMQIMLCMYVLRACVHFVIGILCTRVRVWRACCVVVYDMYVGYIVYARMYAMCVCVYDWL